MSGSLVKNLKLLRIFASYKFFLFLITVVISLNLLIPKVSAAEWEDVPVSDSRILLCLTSTINGDFIEIDYSTTGQTFPLYGGFTWFTLAIRVPIYPDCTYDFSFSFDEAYFNTWNYPLEYSLNLVTELPDSIGDLLEQRNSAGERYIDCTLYSGYENNRQWTFSTADGFIDNIDKGYYYVCFSELLMPYDDVTGEEQSIYFDIYDIRSKCMLDPGAGYFTEKVIESLNSTAAELDKVGSALSEQESWLLDKSKSLRESVADDFANMLNEANALVTPTRRNANSLLGGVEAVGTIFKSFTNSLPPVFASLITTIAILYFIAWLMGRRE